MLSRHDTIHPVALYKVPSRAQQLLFAPSRDKKIDQPEVSSIKTVHRHNFKLCSACRRKPFGNEASPSYRTAWASCAVAPRLATNGATAQRISFKYGRSIQQLRASAEGEDCRWCGILLSAIIQSRSLDDAAKALEALDSETSEQGSNLESADGGEADESGMLISLAGDGQGEPTEVARVDREVDGGQDFNSGPDGKQKTTSDSDNQSDIIDTGSASESVEIDRNFSPLQFNTTTYEVLDEYDQCDITISYLQENPGMLDGLDRFNTLETTIDAHSYGPVHTSCEMLGENTVRLIAKLHTTPDVEDDAAAKNISTRPAEINLGSDGNFEQARHWLAACRTHESCASYKVATQFLPTRVLDIRNPDSPKLHSTSTEADTSSFEYAALSYTWGANQTYITTKASIDDKLKGLDVQKLPRTIIDAIIVCEKLGFYYLWVDSICIIQDSDEDKTREISQMRLIFRCAALTIAAAKSSTVNDGFLNESRPTHFLDPFNVPFHCPEEQMGTAWISVPEFYRPINDPWNSRAWTLEERLLSPRNLIYSYDGLKWLCKSSLLESSEPICRPRPFLELPRISDKPEEGHHGLAKEDEQRELRMRWYDILTEYTERSVTHEKDKLVALAAVSEEFHHLWGGEYLAGLWGQFLFEELLWHRDGTSDFQPWLALSHRPAKYRAPSWSWASVEGKIDIEFGGVTRSPCEFSVLDCYVDLKWEDVPFGPVIGGYLNVEGSLGTGYWCSSTDEDRCDGFITRSPRDSKDNAVAKVSLDAVEPALIPGSQVFCLLVSQITHPPATLFPTEGFILFPTDGGHFRRVGFYFECRAFSWAESFERMQLTIV